MQHSTEQIWALATALDAKLVEMRRVLHRHPELSGEEVWTTAQLKTWLAEAGIDILPLPLKTGLVAEIRGSQPGPIVALRTDIDALPVLEETGLDFASQIPGKMHACGHDFHMATILGAALILKQMESQIAGTVRLLFQPAEETAQGARELIAAGAMNGVQAVFGLHNKPDLPAGHVGVKSGPLMAATDAITIDVLGKGGHAAIPDATIDPVVAGSAIVMALQTAVSRVISPLDSAVVTIASFQAGTAYNVIPPGARLLGTVRTFRPEVRETVLATIERVVREVAAGYRAEGRLVVDQGTPAVNNDPAMADLMRRSAAALGLPVDEAIPTMGGEDFAEYQQLAPGCFVWMGTGCAENWHHPRFMVDESVIHKGAALFASTALMALAELQA